MTKFTLVFTLFSTKIVILWKLGDYHKQLPVIQIYNFHDGRGSFGAPVFDLQGRGRGIYSFILKIFYFVIHLSICGRLFQDYLARLLQKACPMIKGKGRGTGMKFGNDRQQWKKWHFLRGDKGKRREDIKEW